jgi:REP element-mobilizing transposase RayT
MRTGKPEHLRGFDYRGLHQYFLTFCTFDRTLCFLTDDAVSTARTQIERAAGEQSIAVIAYCYMPDHVHFLAEGQSGGSSVYSLEQILDAVQLPENWYRRSG